MIQKRQRFFQSRLARQSFWVLLVGVLLIGAASLTIFSIYFLYGRTRINEVRLANELIRVVTIAKALPVDTLPKTVRSLSERGLHVSMSRQPPVHYQIIQLTEPKFLRQYVYQHHGDIKVSMELASGRWLNIRAHQVQHEWLFMGLLISSVVLLFMLIILCFWSIKRLAIPVDALTSAAQRFGVDMQAPPLALTGPPEVQEVMQAFNEMQARIRRLVHDRTQMLAAISHDLRTPITRLQLRAEYLQGTPQYEKAVADLQEMEQMIASILSFARDYVRSEAMERFDLNALLESLCNDRMDMGHAVRYHSTFSRMPYFGRIGALKRAFSNLIENAVKYGEKTDVSLQRQEEKLQIKIVDEGPGIPEEQLEKVFEPFYRVDPARSPEKSGTGLGLAVARDIIRTHGGEITLFNREPNGLIVLVSLPYNPGSD